MNMEHVDTAARQIRAAKEFMKLALMNLEQAEVALAMEGTMSSDSSNARDLVIHKAEQCSAAIKEIARASDALKCVNELDLFELCRKPATVLQAFGTGGEVREVRRG